MRRLAALAALALLVGGAVAGLASATDPFAMGVARGREAFDYGFPLLEFLRVRRTETSVRCPDHRGDAPLNTFSHAQRLADPSERDVVAPNVDTLYSIAQLDLGRGPVVLSHPAMGRRYFVFELLDPYTNVVGYVGSRTTGARAGRFAITWTRGPRAARRHVRGARLIRSPYRRLWMIGRTLAGDGADQRRARALMRRYTLARAGTRPHRARCRPGKPHRFTTPTGLAFLTALGRALRDNPPPARDKPILRRLAAAGIGPGLKPRWPGLAQGVDAEGRDLPTAARAELARRALANHGWVSLDPRVGNYGTDYRLRAILAEVGLGANTPAEATYPIALADATGAFLTGARRYRLTFRHPPPARAFWSLTLYDSAGFLVANPLRRYAIGSSHPGLVRRRDGSIVVAVQRTRPSEDGVNWLPAPVGGFRLNLRLYWPRRSALTGAWQPPPVEPVG